MDDFEAELKKCFLEEAEQLLSDVEKTYLDLESNPNNEAILDQIFRVAHNLKGSSKAVGFNDVGHFSHHFENLLLKIKNQEVIINPLIISLLLRSNDHLSKMIQKLKESLDATFDSSELLSEIDAALNGTLVVNEEVIHSEVASQQHVNTKNQETLSSDNQTSESNSNLEQTPTPQDINFDNSPIENPQILNSNLELSNSELTHKNNANTEKTNSKTVIPSDESIRVSLARLEKLLNYVGEMVILQTVLKEQAASSSDLLKKTVHQLGKVTKEVQDISMSLRMVPLKTTFQKMHRIVRDISIVLEKKVTLILQGEDTELDKTILERVSDPLVHLIRNACDHGIESPETRKNRNKPEQGTIKLSAYHQNGKLVIDVTDDGGGIDANILRKKAIEKKIIGPSTQISDQDAINLIFHPGFSTKAVVTDVSGRGVGMDVVKHNIEYLQGLVLVETELGKGSTFKIILPLTLAIIDAMIVRVSDSRFVIPLSHVREFLKLDTSDIKQTSGLGEILIIRGETIPLYRLGHLVGKKSQQNQNTHLIALVVQGTKENFAVLVDDIVGQYQVVVKQLGSELENIKGITGSSILGDGKPALILELAELIKKGKGGVSSQNTRGLAA